MDAAAKKKRLSVERIYQKKTQLEHIILRPDSYIGSAEPVTQNMWVWDDANSAIVSKSITYTPGLYKIYDEIIGIDTMSFSNLVWFAHFIICDCSMHCGNTSRC